MCHGLTIKRFDRAVIELVITIQPKPSAHMMQLKGNTSTPNFLLKLLRQNLETSIVLNKWQSLAWSWSNMLHTWPGRGLENFRKHGDMIISIYISIQIIQNHAVAVCRFFSTHLLLDDAKVLQHRLKQRVLRRDSGCGPNPKRMIAIIFTPCILGTPWKTAKCLWQ